MTIATVMGTSLIFLSVGWTGQSYEPMVLVVGGMICIAAANAGATSQDLKSGYIVGATPRNQQIALFVGAIVSSIVIGLTIKFLDRPTAEMASAGIEHAIGTDKYPAPQATLMATLIKGILFSKSRLAICVCGNVPGVCHGALWHQILKFCSRCISAIVNDAANIYWWRYPWIG